VFPLALEGLLAHYGAPLHDRRVILHYNMLWMSSPKADPEREGRAVVQPHKAGAAALRADTFLPAPTPPRGWMRFVERSVGLLGWVNHLDTVYFDQRSIPRWTLEEDDSDLPRHPNAWRNPLSRITLRVPGEPAADPQRGRSSPRHRPWSATAPRPRTSSGSAWRSRCSGSRSGGRSRCCGRAATTCWSSSGPFNEWMIATDQRPAYRKLRAGIDAWLTASGVAHVVPEALPSALYADASHTADRRVRSACEAHRGRHGVPKWAR